MIYAEFIRRDRAIPWEVFRWHGRQDWAAPEDEMVLNLGRTMKVGPEPHYMVWWRIPSIARMDGWEAHFRTPEGRRYMAETPVSRALDFRRCGLYDALAEGGPVPAGALALVEFFDPGEAEDAALRDWFAARGGPLWLLRRVGLAAPEPGGMALWTFPSWQAAEPHLRAKPPAGGPRLASAGFFRPFGEDIP